MIYITPKLETERLILKRGTVEDYKKVYEYDFRKLRDIAGEFKFEKQDPAEIEDFAISTEGTYDFIVYLKETKEPIANITADREDSSINSIELAFNTHPTYWRKGYTTEALIAVMNFLFEKGYDNIICGYDEGNIKSKNLGQKLGFIPYKTIKNAWEKNSVSITTYITILSKERFYQIHYKESTQK